MYVDKSLLKTINFFINKIRSFNQVFLGLLIWNLLALVRDLEFGKMNLDFFMLDFVPEQSGLIFVDSDCPDDFLLAQADFPSEFKTVVNKIIFHCRNV